MPIEKLTSSPRNFPGIATPESKSLLAQERSLLEAISRYMPVGAIVAGAPSGRLIWRNQQAKQISGTLFSGNFFLDTTNIEDYSQWRGFHPDGSLYQPQEWPIIRSITTGKTIKAEEIVIEYEDQTPGTLLANYPQTWRASLGGKCRQSRGYFLFYFILVGRDRLTHWLIGAID